MSFFRTSASNGSWRIIAITPLSQKMKISTSQNLVCWVAWNKGQDLIILRGRQKIRLHNLLLSVGCNETDETQITFSVVHAPPKFLLPLFLPTYSVSSSLIFVGGKRREKMFHFGWKLFPPSRKLKLPPNRYPCE